MVSGGLDWVGLARGGSAAAVYTIYVGMFVYLRAWYTRVYLEFLSGNSYVCAGTFISITLFGYNLVCI